MTNANYNCLQKNVNYIFLQILKNFGAAVAIPLDTPLILYITMHSYSRFM